MNIKALTLGLIAGGAVALGGCAGNPQAPMAQARNKDQCFFADRANGFAAASERVVNVRVGVNDVYRFDLLGPCPDVDWAQSIAILSRGSSWICSGFDATVISPSTLGPQRCPVREVTKLTPAEVAALPSSERP